MRLPQIVLFVSLFLLFGCARRVLVCETDADCRDLTTQEGRADAVCETVNRVCVMPDELPSASGDAGVMSGPGPQLHAIGGRWVPLDEAPTTTECSYVLPASGHRLLCGSTVYSQLFDPVASSWSVSTGKDLPNASGWTANELGNGDTVVVGGSTRYLRFGVPAESFIRAVLSFQPDAGTFSVLPELAEGRTSHTATTLESGDLLVLGGRISGGGIGSSLVLESGSRQWLTSAEMPTPRMGHTATRLNDGRVLVVGGAVPGGSGFVATAVVEVFNPKMGEWQTLKPLNEARTLHSAALLSSGKVLVVGGATDAAATMLLDSVELYDPVTDEWRPINRLAHGRISASLFVLPGDQVVLIGGYRNNIVPPSPEPSVELLELSRDRWRTIDSPPETFQGGLSARGELIHLSRMGPRPYLLE